MQVPKELEAPKWLVSNLFEQNKTLFKRCYLIRALFAELFVTMQLPYIPSPQKESYTRNLRIMLKELHHWQDRNTYCLVWNAWNAETYTFSKSEENHRALHNGICWNCNFLWPSKQHFIQLQLQWGYELWAEGLYTLIMFSWTANKTSRIAGVCSQLNTAIYLRNASNSVEEPTLQLLSSPSAQENLRSARTWKTWVFRNRIFLNAVPVARKYVISFEEVL